MAHVHIEDAPYKLGKHRSEQEKNLRDDWGCETMSELQHDKCKFLEKRSDAPRSFFDKSEIDAADKISTGNSGVIRSHKPNNAYRAGYDLIWGKKQSA